MEDEVLKKLPIEFQKINKVARPINKQESKVNFVSIDFYQSIKIVPQKLNKPISKIIKFDNQY